MVEVKYRLPGSLGGGEIEAEEVWGGCAGAQPEYRLRDGVTILAPPGQPFARVSPLPPEPPLGSVVLIDGDFDPNDADLVPGVVYRSYFGGWAQPGSEDGEPHSWAAVCSHGTPVLLVPDPFAEPVELPWKGQGIEVQRTLSDSGPGQHVHVSTKGATYGFAHVKPDVARAMARALWTAANEAESRQR